METKFTKGEWSQSHRKDRNSGMYSTEVYDDRGQTICTLAWHTEPNETRTDRPENAQLIAAAPDMYAELKSIITLFEWGYNGADLVDETAKQIPIIKELLKKARGE